MKTFKTFGALSAAIAIFATAPSAMAEYVVPPDNSAATQYTETFPTVRGQRDTEKAGARERSPARVLGQNNTRRLDEQGPAGRAAAELAAETAPPAIAPQPADPDEADDGAAGAGGRGGGGPRDGRDGRVDAGAAERRSAIEESSGGSALGEILASATGASSGKLGVFLPLLILGVFVWSLIFSMQRRKKAAA